jgi:signal peptidase I
LSPLLTEEFRKIEPRHFMNGAEKYPGWVGVLLSLCFPGAGQYFSGAKGCGVGWFFSLFFGMGLALFLLAESAIPGIVPAALAAGALVLLWLCMLWDANRPVERLDFLTLGAVLVCGVIIQYLGCWFWVKFDAELVAVRNNLMAPALQQQARPGKSPVSDVMVVEKWAYKFGKPRRGDLILFRTDGLSSEMPRGRMVLRVVALPEEEIAFADGRLVVAGKPVTEPPFNKLRYQLPANGPFVTSIGQSYRVPAGQYLVFADNTAERFIWGPVPEANLLGRVSRVCWPPERVTTFK